MWTGPAPYKPWRGGPFRHVWDHDGGMQADIGAHVVPTVIECLGKLGEQPVEVEGESQYPPDPAYVQPFYRSTLRYADGTKLILESAVGQEGQTPITFEVAGPKGRVWVEGKSQVPMCDPPELFAEAAKLPDDPKRITTDQAFLTRDASHAERPTAETQFSAEIAIHLSNIAFRTGRKLVWDPAKQTVVGDDQAAALVNLPVRAPWRMY
jgi:predicted dehydrogenase